MISKGSLPALFAASLLLLSGCRDRPVAAAVDPDLARKTLKSTLEAWKAGKAIESLAGDNPPVVAQDFDWLAGVKLDSYELLGEGTALDANLKVPVRLTLKGKGTKTVSYIVGTDIKLTVFRALD